MGCSVWDEGETSHPEERASHFRGSSELLWLLLIKHKMFHQTPIWVFCRCFQNLQFRGACCLCHLQFLHRCFDCFWITARKKDTASREGNDLSKHERHFKRQMSQPRLLTLRLQQEDYGLLRASNFSVKKRTFHLSIEWGELKNSYPFFWWKSTTVF